MIVFEVEMVGESEGRYCPIVVCDHCYARISGHGVALFVNAGKPRGLSIGDRFRFEPPLFHVHKDCNHAFESAYRECHGETSFMWVDLWEHLAATLTNAVARDGRQARRIFGVVERVVESGRKP